MIDLLQIISDYYLVSPVMVRSKNRQRKYIKTKQMICLLSNSKDQDIADLLRISRSNVVNSRKAISNNIRFDKQLQSEYKQLERQLLINEIS
jgi:chromosomal replication initiation ATPase DnaA